MSETLASELPMSFPTARPVEIGLEFAPFERETGFPYWNRYAAVNDEFIGIHMDDEEGRAAGYPTAFGMGNLTWAYLHLAVHRWLGDEARIVSLSTQFRSAVTKGTRIVIRGTVSGVRTEGDETIVELALKAEDADGRSLAPGSAVVAIAAGASDGTVG